MPHIGPNGIELELSGGSASARFGIEDNTGIQNRTMNMGSNNLLLNFTDDFNYFRTFIGAQDFSGAFSQIRQQGNITLTSQQPDFKQSNVLIGSNLDVYTNGVLTLYGQTAINVLGFGTGAYTGTPTYNLSVDATGNLIETPFSTGSTVNALNGLTKSGDTILLGGELNQVTTISTNNHQFRVDGASGNGQFIFYVNHNEVGSGGGIYTQTNGVYAIRGKHLNGGTAGYFESSGTALELHSIGTASSFSTSPLVLINNPSTASSVGIGAGITTLLKDSAGVISYAGRFGQSFTDITNGAQSSKFDIVNVNLGTQGTTFSSLASGQLLLPKYGDGLFTGTPTFGAAFDTNGNIIEVALGGSGTTYTVDNGLSESPAGNFQLGGTLIKNTTIAASGNSLNITGVGIHQLVNINNTDGHALSVGSMNGLGLAVNSENNTGMSVNAPNGAGVSVSSGFQNQFAVFNPSTNTVETILNLGRQSSVGASGIGGAINFTLERDDLGGISSNKIVSKWLNAGASTFTSEFSIEGASNGTNNGQLLSISGSGAAKLNKYGINTFAGTPTYLLGVDASGNIVETSAVSGSGSTASDPFWIEVTKSEADTLVASSGLTKGATYKISNVDPTLYGGTDVVLTAVASNKFSQLGTGIFYNPKYNQALETYGIWNNTNTWVTSSVVGTFNHNEVVTANNGAVGTLFSAIGGNRFTVTSGDFSTATSITGNATSATANIASVALRTYAINDTVIWGGKHWTNTTGLVGTSTSVLLLDSNWTVIPYNTVDYNVSLDAILYDYENDLIVRRQDKNGNVVEASKATVTIWSNPRTIALFQWGNPYVESTFKGCGNNQVINGYVDNINMIGCFAHNIFMSKSYFSGNNVFVGVFIGNRVNGGSHISNNTVLSGGINNNNFEKGNVSNNNFSPSAISSNSLQSSWILSNDLQITSTMNDNRLSNFSYIYNNFIKQNSSITGNIYNSSYIWNNSVAEASSISFNTSTAAASIRGNELFYASQINSNNLTNANTFIYINKLSSSSRINSNTLNNAYIVRNTMLGFAFITSNSITGSTGANAATISTNNMISGDIQFNTLNGIRADIFGNNLIVPIGYTDTLGRAKIEYNSITIANGRIELCTLEGGGVIRNVNINANALKVRKVDLYGQTLDMGNVPLTSTYEHNRLLAIEGKHPFKVTFTGANGLGAIGLVNIPNYPVPTGYFIENVIVDVTGGLTSAGGVLNLGISTDSPTAGLNDVSGEVSALNGFVTAKVNPSTFVKSTGARNITLEVKNAAITAGTITFTVTLTKLV